MGGDSPVDLGEQIQREQFEQWYKTLYPARLRKHKFPRQPTGLYVDLFVELRWQGWLASYHANGGQ